MEFILQEEKYPLSQTTEDIEDCVQQIFQLSFDYALRNVCIKYVTVGGFVWLKWQTFLWVKNQRNTTYTRGKDLSFI